MKKKVMTLISAVAPPIIWAGLIFFLSNQSQLPALDEPFQDVFVKNLAHTTVFAILFYLIQRAQHILLPETKHSAKPIELVTPLALTIAYAMIDEVHQSFTPGRMPSLNDIGFDLLGASLVLWRTNPQAPWLNWLGLRPDEERTT